MAYYETFKDFRKRELEETLQIKSKNWNFSLPGYNVEINDSIKHNLVDRSFLRTTTPLNTIKEVLQKGIDYIGSKIEKQKLTTRTMVTITFTKSDFKALVLVNPDEKYIRISTIMNPEMPTKRDIKWNLNEFQAVFWNVNVNKGECFAFDCDLEEDFGTTFLVEPSLCESTHEVFQQENIPNFELDI